MVGDWDVLVEVDADDLDALGAMIEDINGVDGIVSTDSAIVLNRRDRAAWTRRSMTGRDRRVSPG